MFPNSGIRGKAFVLKIGFKPRVMRLNRVESFYVFLLCFCSEGSKEEGRLATASPYAGPTTHGQAVAKAPCKGAVDYSQGQPAREVGVAHRGSSPQGRPVPLAGVVSHKGGACLGWLRLARRPQGAVTRGQPGHKGGRPLAGWLPVGKGSPRLRRGTNDSSTDGARGVRASF
ncbi:hypothetical protein GW17_00048389 [Ensete ventricosum]|nr:hypothetical protein GW17_00048389 [Ensete ventricosum]